MKAQGIADSVTTIVGSEFGRTITPNSNLGSDHGWGGNYFVFGGDVKGGNILGKYPRSFLESDESNIGRGRLMPSRSWDSLWFGVAQWFGITNQLDLDETLPNSQNFGCDLFTDTDLFNSGTNSVIGCGGPNFTTDIVFQVPAPRYLTGEEQKDICRLTVATASKQLTFDPTETRCYIANQGISPNTKYPGMYDVSGVAILNFDVTITPERVSVEKVQAVAKIASATASDFIVSGAIEQSEAPSASPSDKPSSEPSKVPSAMPSVSAEPSYEPSISSQPSASPSAEPSYEPSISSQPSLSSMPSSSPSISSSPTNSPVVSRLSVYATDLVSTDVGSVGVTGSSYIYSSGYWIVRGSGRDIWGSQDGFHYLRMPTSGDLTVSILIHGFLSSHQWSKGGVMLRDTLDAGSTYYGMFLTGSNGMHNQFRYCIDCSTYNYMTENTKPDSVWLRVSKVGNIFRAYIKHTNEKEWTQYGATVGISFTNPNFYVGIAVTSHQNDDISTLYGTDFELTRDCSSSSITGEFSLPRFSIALASIFQFAKCDIVVRPVSDNFSICSI